MITLNAKITNPKIKGILRKLLIVLDRDQVFMKDAIREWSRFVDERIQKNLGGVLLNRRTGHLARNYRWLEAQKVGAGWRLQLRSKAPYARIQEEGGTITPKNSQYLAIPLPRELSRNKVLTPVGVQKKGPRDFPDEDTFVAESKKGNLIIFLKQSNTPSGRARANIPLFVLKKRVTVPASRWFSTSVREAEDRLQPTLQKRFARTLARSTR